eukprot:c44016_g1_i1 orf=102-440(-)
MTRSSDSQTRDHCHSHLATLLLLNLCAIAVSQADREVFPCSHISPTLPLPPSPSLSPSITIFGAQSTQSLEMAAASQCIICSQFHFLFSLSLSLVTHGMIIAPYKLYHFEGQ